jgi:outer membrane biosynthesis protein TonB
MNVSRPKSALLSLAVLGALLAGCQPAASAPADSPAADPSSSSAAAADPAIDPALADPTDPAALAPAVTTAPPATTAVKPATTAVKPATTKKPAVKATTHKPAPKPKPTTKKPAPKPTTKPPSAGVVHPGAFCSPVGARGVTSKGTPMRCTLKSGEPRARWRAA